MKMRSVLRIIWMWPPFLGAGVRVRAMNETLTEMEVELKLRFWNRNYVGTQFGGSLYSMADPFYMLMLIENLGREYIVWDKEARIRFKRPGRANVRAKFTLTPEKLAEIRAEVAKNGKAEFWFPVEVKDEAGELVAIVDKLLYVRAKEDARKAELAR